MIINDAKSRQEALDPTKSFIVQAPAGSGKTELLTQRYLVLLSHAEKAPEEIIAITFTRKAAAEMRARIMHALTFAHTKPTPEKDDYRYVTWKLAKAVLLKDDKNHWELLKNPNRLRILTIDALSAFLCRQAPLLTQFGGSVKVSENAASLYQLAAQRLLQDTLSLPKWQPIGEKLLLHLDNNISKCEKLFSDLLANREQWLSHILFCHTHDQIRDVLENNLKRIAIEKMQIAASLMPEQCRQVIILLTRHAGLYFEENNPSHPLAHCADFTWEKKPLLSHFNSWIGLANLFLTQKGEWRKSVTVSNGFPPKDKNKSLMLSILTELENHNAFKESLNDILDCPPAVYSDHQWETLTALTQILPLLAAQLSLVFREKGEIDFLELNLSALKALGDEENPTDLALYLDYQIKHLLIDEFQDTSLIHLHILEKIIAEWEPHDHRTLFVVGDPMQSIYRFRNAEVGLFLRAQEQGIGQLTLEPLTLTMNFRSQKNLVSWFNNTFHTIFPAVSDIPTGRVPYTQALAARDEYPNYHAHFYPVFSKNEAMDLVNQLEIIHQNYPNDSIAILARSRSQLTIIIQCLHEKKLSFQAIDIEPLSNRSEIRDLLSLTRALFHRADRIAWLAILRAPFCGCVLFDLEIIANASTHKTIWEVILKIEDLPELSSDGLQRITRLRHILQHAFHNQYQLSISEWIEGCWMMLGGPASLLDPIELNNTKAYFQLISKMENDRFFSIDSLTEQCEQLFANGVVAGASTSFNSNKQQFAPIQIMTIHKSKGLEFDHVFIPELHRQTPADSEKLFRWLERPNALGGDDLILAPIKPVTVFSDPIYDFLKKTENKKQDYEITRLFYVASTRAKKSLHLFTTIDVNENNELKMPKKGSFLEKLWPIYENEIKKQLLKFRSTQTPETEIRSPSFFRLASDWRLPLFNDKAMMLQNTPIKSFVKIDLSLPSYFSRIVGTVIHEVLQTLAHTGSHHFYQWKNRLIALGILPHELNNAIKTVQLAIEKTLADERGQWILSSHINSQCEWTLTYFEEEMKNIIIDRTFIDKDNIRWIIDYKTTETIERKKEYIEQLETYAKVISQMENYPIKCGLYFPLCAGWIEWDFSATCAKNPADSSLIPG